MGKEKEKIFKKKRDTTKLRIIFSTLILAVIFIAELYAIINMSEMFAVIAGLAALFLIVLYVLVSAITAQIEGKHERGEEQYDNIFKSEKASYMLLRKYFGDFEKQMESLTQQVESLKSDISKLEESAKIPTHEITRTQKGMGKVIISRNRENAEAILNSNDLLIEQFKELQGVIAENNNQLVEIYRKIGNENNQPVINGQKSMLIDLKDMELRLNNAIVQGQKNMTSQPAFYAAPVMPPMQASMPTAPMSNIQPMAAAEPELMPEPMAAIEPEPMPEPMEAVEPEPMPEPMAAVEPEPMPEPMALVEPEPMPEPMEAIEPEPIPEPVEEEKPPMPDMSDPNKKMSADDIAALFANMAGNDDTAPAAEPEPEPIPEPVEEEKPPMPDMSDPNKKMSPDDIAALFANMAGNDNAAPAAEPEPEPIPEPVVEEKPPMPDMSDPNKKMSPDDIAALFASMAG